MPDEPGGASGTNAGGGEGSPKIDYKALAEALKPTIGDMVTGAVKRQTEKATKDLSSIVGEKIKAAMTVSKPGTVDDVDPPAGSEPSPEANAMQKQIAKLQKALEKSDNERQAAETRRETAEKMSAIREAAVSLTKPDIYAAVVSKSVVRLEDGNFGVQTGETDAAGDPVYVSIGDHAKKFATENPEFAPASGGGGSGAGVGTGGGDKSPFADMKLTREDFNTMDMDELNSHVAKMFGGNRYKSGDPFADTTLTPEEMGRGNE